MSIAYLLTINHFIFSDNIAYFIFLFFYIILRLRSTFRVRTPFVFSNWSHAESKQKKREGKKVYTQNFAIPVVVIRSYECSLICLKRAFVRDGSARIALELYRMAVKSA